MEVFEAEGYRELLRHFLTEGKSRAPRGKTSSLARALKCHVTFISQVARGLADFSPDQSLAFCKAAHYTEDETHFFLDLLTYERAGTVALKSLLAKKIEKKRSEFIRAGKRFKSENLAKEDQQKYFCDPGLQLIHVLIQLEGIETAQNISDFMGCEVKILIPYLKDLVRMGIVDRDAEQKYTSRLNFIHLERGSAEFQFYTNFWRQFARLQVLGNSQRSEKEMSLTSLVVTSEEAAEKIRTKLAKQLESIGEEVKDSKSECLYFLALDFVKMRGPWFAPFA